ncbi:MAG: hypothetical protein LUQ04_08250 [Methanoregula sp.]|nr:hypothetical protein [Methanoregula sp.]
MIVEYRNVQGIGQIIIGVDIVPALPLLYPFCRKSEVASDPVCNPRKKEVPAMLLK